MSETVFSNSGNQIEESVPESSRTSLSSAWFAGPTPEVCERVFRGPLFGRLIFTHLKDGKGWEHKRGDLKMPFSA